MTDELDRLASEVVAALLMLNGRCPFCGQPTERK